MFQLQKKKLLHQQVSSDKELKVKKLVLVLTTSMLVTTARKEVVEKAKTGKNRESLKTTAGAGEEGKNTGTNFIQVSYI